jgi:hypothetical protein
MEQGQIDVFKVELNCQATGLGWNVIVNHEKVQAIFMEDVEFGHPSYLQGSRLAQREVQGRHEHLDSGAGVQLEWLVGDESVLCLLEEHIETEVNIERLV